MNNNDDYSINSTACKSPEGHVEMPAPESLVCEIQSGRVAAGTVLSMNEGTLRHRIAGIVDDENPPISINPAAFGGRESIFSLAGGAWMIWVCGVDARDKVCQGCVWRTVLFK